MLAFAAVGLSIMMADVIQLGDCCEASDWHKRQTPTFIKEATHFCFMFEPRRGFCYNGV